MKVLKSTELSTLCKRLLDIFPCGHSIYYKRIIGWNVFALFIDLNLNLLIKCVPKNLQQGFDLLI